MLGPCRVQQTPLGQTRGSLHLMSWSLHIAVGVTCALWILNNESCSRSSLAGRSLRMRRLTMTSGMRHNGR